MNKMDINEDFEEIDRNNAATTNMMDYQSNELFLKQKKEMIYNIEDIIRANRCTINLSKIENNVSEFMAYLYKKTGKMVGFQYEVLTQFHKEFKKELEQQTKPNIAFNNFEERVIETSRKTISFEEDYQEFFKESIKNFNLVNNEECCYELRSYFNRSCDKCENEVNELYRYGWNKDLRYTNDVTEKYRKKGSTNSQELQDMFKENTTSNETDLSEFKML